MEQTGTKTLETAHLILRRYRMEDYTAMYRNWASDPVVTRFLTWKPHSSEEVTREIVSGWVNRYEDPASYHWGITLKDSGSDEVIGDISVVHTDMRIPSAEIGYCLSRKLWGKGIMTEALEAVKLFLFDEGFLRVCACHDVNNPASGRVMDKADLISEGVLRCADLNNTGVFDVRWHAAIRSDRAKQTEQRKEQQT